MSDAASLPPERTRSASCGAVRAASGKLARIQNRVGASLEQDESSTQGYEAAVAREEVLSLGSWESVEPFDDLDSMPEDGPEMEKLVNEKDN